MLRSQIIMKKLLTGNMRIFQLCQIRRPQFPFSSNKDKINQKSQSSHQQSKPSGKSSMERLKKIKQQQRQEAYRQKLNDINLTSGSFNPLTGYFWINRSKIILAILSVMGIYFLIDEDSLFCIKTMGIFKDPFTGKKKFLAINPYRQSLLQKTILSIVKKQVNIISEDSLIEGNSKLNKALQNKLQLVLEKLKEKYQIEFKNQQGNKLNYELTQLEDGLFLWIVGDQKLVLSTKLLKLGTQHVQNIILLVNSLHQRYLHIQNISFWQRSKLKPSTDTKNIVKLEKTFVSNIFSAQNIASTIDLISKKYSKDNEEERLKMKQKIMASLKQLVVVNKKNKNEKGGLTEFDLRNRLAKAMDILN